MLPRSRTQHSEEGSNTYSTPNREWEVLGSFQSGQVLEMDLIMNTNHMVSAIEPAVFQLSWAVPFHHDDGANLTSG